MASKKYEKLIEYVIANDVTKARELFHRIVVGASRKIYEDFDVESPGEALDDVEADHSNFDEPEEDGLEEFGGDEADDLETDTFADDEFEGEGDGDELNPDIDDRVADLESEFDALKAEFEAALGELNGDEDEDGIEDDVEDSDFDADEVDDIESEDESDLEDDNEEAEESDEDAEEDVENKPVDEAMIREYVDKVTKGLSNSSEESFVQKKSPVAGKNEIVKGVGPKNIAQGGTEKGRTAPPTKELIGNDAVVNRPGHKAKLKPAPKPTTSKEGDGINKRSIES